MATILLWILIYREYKDAEYPFIKDYIIDFGKVYTVFTVCVDTLTLLIFL